MTEAEHAELLRMRHGLCFAGPEPLSAACTLPKGHGGSHVCTFDVLDRYLHLIRLATQEHRTGAPVLPKMYLNTVSKKIHLVGTFPVPRAEGFTQCGLWMTSGLMQVHNPNLSRAEGFSFCKRCMDLLGTGV